MVAIGAEVAMTDRPVQSLQDGRDRSTWSSATGRTLSARAGPPEEPFQQSRARSGQALGCLRCQEVPCHHLLDRPLPLQVRHAGLGVGTPVISIKLGRNGARLRGLQADLQDGDPGF